MSASPGRRAQQAVIGILGRRRGDEHERPVPGRRLRVASNGGSHSSGPTTSVPGGQARGYSSWGNVATMHSSLRQPALTPVDRREPELDARRVQLVAAASSPRSMSGRGARHSALPDGVRGSRAPIEYGGMPGSSAGGRAG